MKVFTFKRGGVHPPGHKTLSEHKPISSIELPDSVGISLNEHLGKPAVPIVKKGQDVVVGECIGNPDGFLSAYIHSSVAGKVSKIETGMTAIGTLAEFVTIDVDKEKTAEGYAAFTNRQPADFKQMEVSDILEKIKQASASSGWVEPLFRQISNCRRLPIKK